jgi:SAM-dependent methyltransferase
VSASDVQSYKRDFWNKESPKFAMRHYRLVKAARLINKMAGTRQCSLLDIGCGPATLASVLGPNIRYYGIDIAIQDPAPNLLEADILEAPIKFGDLRFDIVVALGVFEYLGNAQDEKFSEIAGLLNPDGTFIVSYTNFAHRNPQVYHAFSNVQPVDRFRNNLERHFIVPRMFPTAYNWSHGQPRRSIVKRANMCVNATIPLLHPKLAIEYFFVCSPRRGRQPR